LDQAIVGKALVAGGMTYSIINLSGDVIAEGFTDVNLFGKIYVVEKDNRTYLSMANLDGDNPVAIVLYKDTLTMENYTRGYKGDIITLIQKTTCGTFTEVLESITSILNFTPTVKKINVLRDKMSTIERWTCPIDETELEEIPEHIFDNYIHKPNKIWFDEGIKVETQAFFQIQYCDRTNTIIIPIRDEKGRLVGIKNRKNTTLDVPIKYFYSFPVKKNRILYNLHNAKEYIKEKKYVIVVESEKSVMKLWQSGFKNVVAIAGSDLSINQVCMLEKLNTFVVLAFDKDKSMEHMNKQLLKFIKTVKIGYMYDDNNLLDEKDAPIDKGVEVFEKIIKKIKQRRVIKN